jgi:hypothetical protein
LIQCLLLGDLYHPHWKYLPNEPRTVR